MAVFSKRTIGIVLRIKLHAMLKVLKNIFGKKKSEKKYCGFDPITTSSQILIITSIFKKNESKFSMARRCVFRQKKLEKKLAFSLKLLLKKTKIDFSRQK
jgi:hypothetical protein